MGQNLISRRRTSEGLGRMIYHEQLPQGVHIVAENGWIRVEFWCPNVVRVRMGRPDEEVDNFSYALDPNGDWYDAEVEIKLESDHFLLSADEVEVMVFTDPIRLVMLDQEGRLVNQDDIGVGTRWMGQEVTAYKTLQPGERFLGLGEKTGPLDKRGRAYVNLNTDNFGYGPDSDPLYASIPFYIGVHDQGIYGIFLNNSYKSTFNFGASSDRFAWFSVDDGQMDYFYIHGGLKNGIAGVLHYYGWLTGKGAIIPKWALGFQQCRYSYYPAAEVLRIAQTFREKQIPCDVLYLDIHYMDAFKVFTWHPEYFPDPKKLAEQLKELGIRLVVIMDPGIKVEPGYEPYDTGIRDGHFAKLPDGEPYSGQVWPGWSHFPDFTQPETRKWWGEQMSIYSEAGIAGFWNDMNEPAAWGQHLPGLIEFDMEGELGSFKEARNVYGMQMARATFDGARELRPGERPFNLTRAGFAGIQRYAAVWTGDNTASEEHMLAGVRLVNSLSLSGVFFAGYDVGGFVGEPNPGLYARWMQLGAFSPFFRAHTMINSRDAEPWAFGEEVEDIARNFIRLRYRLMPYIYTAFAMPGLGPNLPVVQSLAMEWPHDPKIYQQPYDAQYLFGPDILVIPVESHKSLTKIYLPEGEWYDFYDDRKYVGGQEHIIELSIERLPLFVRAGAVIPMQSAVQHMDQPHDGILDLHVYAGTVSERSMMVYDDDGISYDHLAGAYSLRQGVHKAAERNLAFQQIGHYQDPFKRLRIHFHGAGDLKSVNVNGMDIGTSIGEFRAVEPVSRFDPFLPPVGFAPSVKDLPFIVLEESKHSEWEIRY
ncbi:MAG: glycoside hydrolase family 31 protein [Bacteroidia bacterium]